MSYVWSGGHEVGVMTVSEFTPISRVDIESVEPERPEVGEDVVVLVRIEFQSPIQYDQRIEAVLAVNEKTNIIDRLEFVAFYGMSSTSCKFTVRFSAPGTYTLYAGARVVEAYRPAPR